MGGGGVKYVIKFEYIFKENLKKFFPVTSKNLASGLTFQSSTEDPRTPSTSKHTVLNRVVRLFFLYPNPWGVGDTGRGSKAVAK